MCPKKWGVNDKKTDAIERKNNKKQSEKQKKEEEKGSKEWEETDKNAIRKEQRKKEKEKKREEELKRKKEKQDLYNQEMASLPSKGKAEKITQHSAKKVKDQIEVEALKKYHEEENKKKIDYASDAPIPVNINHAAREEEVKCKEKGIELITATGVDEAFSKLSIEDPDKHPEKRMKQAFTLYEEKRLPELKAEFPTLKRSQHLEMLHEEWKKSPENPINKPHVAYDHKV